ncbi:hypothetical protein PWT90_11273 [Aphanocladium album]|nr:hypothetical protein PWT90_11273 [Aphanocladium album]
MPWGGPQDRQPTRGMTPFAYATPYSNAPAPPPMPQQENGYRARSGSVVRFEVHQPYYRHRSSSRPTVVPHTMLIDDDDEDVKIYNSESDEDYDDEDDGGGGDTDSVEMVTDAQPQLRPVAASGWPGMPEDEPWPGIEDRGAPLQRSGDAENIDPNTSGSAAAAVEADVLTVIGGAAQSEMSSQPSEYPSTQLIKHDEDEDEDFLIHED